MADAMQPPSGAAAARAGGGEGGRRAVQTAPEEARRRAIVDSIPALLWAAAADGTATFIADQWYRYTGLARDVPAHDWPRLVLHPNDLERCAAQWGRALRQGTAYEIEARYRRHDGVYRWMLTRAVPGRDATGQIPAWFGCTIDLHERKEALRRAAQGLRDAEAGRPAAREREDTQATLNTALREHSQARDHALDDSERAASAAREANQQLLLAGLREQERAERAEAARRRAAFLAEASRRLAATFDAEAALRDVAALAVPTVADFCLVDVLAPGGALRLVAGVHADAAQSARFDELRRAAPPRDRASHPVAGALAAREPVVVSPVSDAWMRSVAISQEHHEFMQQIQLRSAVIVPLVVGERQVGAMTFCFTAAGGRWDAPVDLALVQDLASRVALAVENARLYGELQQALRVRDDFLASTAHDLRTPLTVIRGYAHVLRRQLAPAARAATGATTATGKAPRPRASAPPRALEGLVQIEAAVGRMTRLIGALQDAARLQAGHGLYLDKRPSDLTAIARRLTAEHARNAERHRIRVETDAPELVGDWDPERLERTLDNLLGNAIKFSPGGGDVVVAVAQEGSEAVLRVRDDGVGIPAADRQRIFERFHRAANVVGQIGGAGIGLADVHQVVTEHGGTISVESQEPDARGRGGGSTFTMRLPLRGA